MKYLWLFRKWSAFNGTLPQPRRSGHARKTVGDEDRTCPHPPGRWPDHKLVPEGCLTRGRACPEQRHFCVFAVSFPGQEALAAIYSTILSQHLVYRAAPAVVQRMSGQLVNSALGERARLPPANPAAFPVFPG